MFDDELTKALRITQVIFTFVTPVICAYGFVSNILSAIVFANKKLRSNQIFIFLFIIACANIWYFMFGMTSFVIVCEPWCNFQNTFGNQFYIMLCFNFLKLCSPIFILLFHILVALQRLLIILNITKFKLPGMLICFFLCLFISILCGMPYIFQGEIIKYNGTNTTDDYYSLTLTNSTALWFSAAVSILQY
ncbi:unnamed protein product [Brachionus calyciflorus]|uniref:G-protein coupled receptors family 1 profile domain-containing protein n=1 Tax=Brachionus calyciflorus TaxID=104777 RepID=A0A814JH47_9BILA|nr:unnamed protein product [Brachionus calyciflorus]